MSDVPGRYVADLLAAVGVDWSDGVYSTIIEIDAPGVMTVRRYKRNERGTFYHDPNGSGQPADETLVFGIDWSEVPRG